MTRFLLFCCCLLLSFFLYFFLSDPYVYIICFAAIHEKTISLCQTLHFFLGGGKYFFWKKITDFRTVVCHWKWWIGRSFFFKVIFVFLAVHGSSVFLPGDVLCRRLGVYFCWVIFFTSFSPWNEANERKQGSLSSVSSSSSRTIYESSSSSSMSELASMRWYYYYIRIATRWFGYVLYTTPLGCSIYLVLSHT